jgi:hypothetical protein
MNIHIDISGQGESHSYFIEDMESLDQVLAMMLSALQIDFPYVVGLAAETPDGNMIWDDPFGG